MIHFAAPLLALVLAAPSPALPGVKFPTPTGDVWVETASPGAGKPREGVGRGMIEAPPERVFRALTDYGHWTEFMPFLVKSDARLQADGSTLAEHVMKLPAPTGERDYRVRLHSKVDAGPAAKTWTIDWAFVPGSGNVKAHHGSWTLTALGPGRTMAVLRLYTDPGGLTPQWAVDRGTAETIPWIFHGLRQQVRRSRYDGS